MHGSARAASPWQSPVTIPEELLLRIFTYVVDDVLLPELETSQIGFPENTDPFVISHVCQLWRKVAVLHEPFWCNIDFGNKNIALLYLSRTNLDTPLHVRFTGAGGPIDQYQCVKQRMKNINSLMVHPRHYVDIHPILQFLVHNPPSNNLKTFHVSEEQNKHLVGAIDPISRDHSQRHHFSTHLTADFLDIFRSMESLRSVEDLLLDSVEIPLRSPAYDNLVHLDLFDFKPHISPVELLLALGRSPRLETLNLTAVLADIAPGEVVKQSEVELLELYELNVVSGSFQSTFYLLEQIYAPELYNLDVEVTSDGSTFELNKLLSTREDSLMFDRIETVMLSQIPHGAGVALSGYTHSDELEVICRIRIHNCTWESQYGRPIFSDHLSSVIRIELLDDDCNIVKLLDGHAVQELMLGGHILTRVLKHLRPGCLLADIMRLELDCSSIGKTRTAESCLEWLRMSEQLQLLRLYGYASLAREDVQRFERFGLQSGVEVEWAGKDALEPLTLPYPMPKFNDSGGGKDTDKTLLCIKRKQEEDGSFNTNTKRQKRSASPSENMEHGFSMESVEMKHPQNDELWKFNQDGMELD